MNSYRFKINNPLWPGYVIQKLPNLEAAEKYARDNDYTLMRYLDPDREFYVKHFTKEN